MTEGPSPVVDPRVLEELVASVEGDHDFVRQLIDTYLADSSGLVAAAEAAVAASDPSALVRPAHTLKSSSATLGATRLSATARTLELAAREGGLDGGEVRAAAERLRSEWEATAAQLQAWGQGTGER